MSSCECSGDNCRKIPQLSVHTLWVLSREVSVLLSCSSLMSLIRNLHTVLLLSPLLAPLFREADEPRKSVLFSPVFPLIPCSGLTEDLVGVSFDSLLFYPPVYRLAEGGQSNRQETPVLIHRGACAHQPSRALDRGNACLGGRSSSQDWSYFSYSGRS